MKRNGVRKAVLGLAVLSFASALIALGTFVWAAVALGVGNVATASVFAITLFLGCCGGVLYFMSLPPRPVNTDQQPSQAAEGLPAKEPSSTVSLRQG